jgi:hypothetical protein
MKLLGKSKVIKHKVKPNAKSDLEAGIEALEKEIIKTRI